MEFFKAIKETREDLKEILVTSSGDDVKLFQGQIQALKDVLEYSIEENK